MNPKLPILAVAFESMAIPFRNAMPLVNLFAIPAGVVFVAALLGDAVAAGLQGGGTTTSLALLALGLVSDTAVVAASVPAACAWHRIHVYPEGHPKRRAGYWISAAELDYGRRVAPFLAGYLVFRLAAFAAAGMIDALDPVVAPLIKLLVLAFAGLPMAVGLGFVAMRGGLALPATAIGIRMKFQRASRLMTGNTWSMLAIVVLAGGLTAAMVLGVLMAVAVVLVPLLALVSSVDSAGFAFGAAVAFGLSVTYVAVAAAILSALSLALRRLVIDPHRERRRPRFVLPDQPPGGAPMGAGPPDIGS